MVITHHGHELSAEYGAASPGDLNESASAVEASRESTLQRYRGIAVGLAISDAVCVVVALVGSYYIRYPVSGVLPLRESLVIAVSPLLWLAVFQAFDLYDPLHLSPPEEFRRVIGASGVGIVLLGSTGSIGTSTIKVAEDLPDQIRSPCTGDYKNLTTVPVPIGLQGRLEVFVRASRPLFRSFRKPLSILVSCSTLRVLPSWDPFQLRVRE